MARPRDTSQYPGDEQILDKIEEGLAEGRFPSGEAAIKHYLSRIEGPTQEAKLRRFHRKLSRRRASQDTADDGFNKILAAIPTHEGRLRFIASIRERSARIALKKIEMGSELRRIGYSTDSEEGRSLLTGLILASLKDESG